MFVGPNTACRFALSVLCAWLDAAGMANTLRMYSPVAGRTYTGELRAVGRRNHLLLANHASVSFGG